MNTERIAKLSRIVATADELHMYTILTAMRQPASSVGFDTVDN